MKHTNETTCVSCEQKLISVHPYLRDWFHRLKLDHLDLHISWGFRDKENQDKAFSEGKSKLKWPDSKHNKMKDGVPCSEALDLFQLVNGQAVFDKVFYGTLATKCKKNLDDIAWGGLWKSLGDFDHFEYHELS